MFDNGNVPAVGDILFVTPSTMVRMTMSDNTFIHSPPGIDINIGLLAVDSFVIKNE